MSPAAAAGDLGVVFTPPPVADFVARRLLQLAQGDLPPNPLVLDPAAGTGALLAALMAACATPQGWRWLGWEISPAFTDEARRALPALPHLALRCVDALSQGAAAELEGQVDLLIANPPYVAEKGQRARFAQLRQCPRWRDRIAQRADLYYLFIHLALDLLRPGGWAAFITPAYWTTATMAAKLRAALAAQVHVVEVIDFGQTRLFPEANFQCLVWFVRRAAPGPARHLRVEGWLSAAAALSAVEAALVGRESAALTTCTLPPPPRDGGPWSCAAPAERRIGAALDADALPLSHYVRDLQGVVSGLDRDADGRGVFLWRAEEVRQWAPEARRFLVPLLRGAALEPGEVIGDVRPDPLYLLYLSGRESPEEIAPLLPLLTPHRARLEQRREVRLGGRPWWALQWPRDPGLIRAPKLVCPRRAAHASFAMDLARHAVSSDCTALVPHVASDLPWLNLLLNSSLCDFQLQTRGKRKGKLIELYAAPLRAVMLPRDAGARLQPLVALAPASFGLAQDLAVLQALALDGATQEALMAHAQSRWLPQKRKSGRRGRDLA